jgi:hypothetical protein
VSFTKEEGEMIQKFKVFACLTFACALLIPALACYAANEGADSPVNKTYYTAVNIWFEDAAEIATTNYHKGQIIPVNTKVVITKYGNSGFSFTDQKGIEYSVLYVKKHSVLPVKEIFDRYFSEQKVPLGRFTQEERENIEAGTILEGMSKEAMLVSYGYPPAHQTPSLESNQWKYWGGRMISFFVYFNKDGKVSRIGNE